jgi:glyoxalase family protein
MNLAGLHHITMITEDAQRNVAFYADLLGLRLVKKTVNFDAPQAYHLYFGDEQGTPGSILTWFEFAGARRGRAGLGMIHTLQLGVASAASLDFWADRLQGAGSPSSS